MRNYRVTCYMRDELDADAVESVSETCHEWEIPETVERMVRSYSHVMRSVVVVPVTA